MVLQSVEINRSRNTRILFYQTNAQKVNFLSIQCYSFKYIFGKQNKDIIIIIYFFISITI